MLLYRKYLLYNILNVELENFLIKYYLLFMNTCRYMGWFSKNVEICYL